MNQSKQIERKRQFDIFYYYHLAVIFPTQPITSMLYINFKFWESTGESSVLVMAIERVFLKGFVFSHDYLLYVDIHFLIKTLFQVRVKNHILTNR